MANIYDTIPASLWVLVIGAIVVLFVGYLFVTRLKNSSDAIKFSGITFLVVLAIFVWLEDMYLKADQSILTGIIGLIGTAIGYFAGKDTKSETKDDTTH